MQFLSESALRKGLGEFEQKVQRLCGSPAAETQGYEEQVDYVFDVLCESEHKERVRCLLASADVLNLGRPTVVDWCVIKYLGHPASSDSEIKADGQYEGRVVTFGLAGSSYALEVRFPFGDATFVRPDPARKRALLYDEHAYAEASVDHFVVIKAAEFLKLSKTVRKQDLNRDLLVSADKVKTILFISHIWEKDGHPDETNRQLKGVKKFLGHIKTVVKKSAKCDWGVQGLELRHGQFQAAVVVGRDHFKSEKDDVWSGEDPLENVGVWYDFMCLPQGADRTGAEKALFQKSLAGLANFIAHENVHVVALRFEDEKDKTFDDRGWCQAEFSCRVGRPVVYWRERDGDPVTDEEVYNVAGLLSPVTVTCMQTPVVESWDDFFRMEGSNIIGRVAGWFDRLRGDAVTVGWLPRGPFGPHQIAPTTNRVDLLGRRVTERLRIPPLALQHDIDLEAWIPGLLAEFGFHVTNGKDAALVGFMMLYWANYDEVDSRKLFAQAIDRVVNQEKVVIQFIGVSGDLVIPWKVKIDRA